MAPKSRDILIGREIADNIGLNIGDTFVLNTPKADGKLTATNFNVTGTVTTGGKEEELLFMSTEDIRSIVGDKDYDVVEASVEASQAELQKIADEISAADKALTPQLVKRVTASQDVVLEKLQALVWIVSIVVLIIMMICVSTTMMAVITERRKEIGLKSTRCIEQVRRHGLLGRGCCPWTLRRRTRCRFRILFRKSCERFRLRARSQFLIRAGTRYGRYKRRHYGCCVPDSGSIGS